MTATDTDREVTALQVLRYPSGTTLRFVLLVVMVALSAVSVGNWTFLSTHPAFPLPSWQWLTIPPITILMVAAVLTAFAPVWLEHRRRWVAVPPDRGGAALARYDTLVAEAGLAATPPLVWNPVDTSSRALAYGLPGYYRVAVGPALLGAARRRPAAFDAVLRHELAHIRHRDVAIAYYAVIVWYVLIVVLAVPPLLWWVVDHDLSLVPEYVLRMVVLTLLVYWVRSALLRVREHYADVRAGDSAPAQQALRAALNAPASTSWPRRMFSLHPTADSRINVLADPRGLARLETAELFAVGLTATWTLPLLYELLVSLGLSPLDAPRSARILMFAMVGAYVGAVVARWAGCAAPVRDSARAAIGLVVGLSLGSVLSVGSTGLLSFVGDELAGMVLSAIIAGAYLFWAADLARVLLDPGQPHRRRVGIATSSVATTLVFALVVGASFAAVELVRLGGGSSALEVLLSKHSAFWAPVTTQPPSRSSPPCAASSRLWSGCGVGAAS